MPPTTLLPVARRYLELPPSSTLRTVMASDGNGRSKWEVTQALGTPRPFLLLSRWAKLYGVFEAVVTDQVHHRVLSLPTSDS